MRYVVMNKITKFIPLIFSTFLISGCGGSDNYSTPTYEPEQEKPLEIKSITALSKIADTNGNYKLITDLDFSTQTSWTPIKGFKGTLDCDNHTISNFNYEYIAENNVGLFGTLEGTVKNLNLSGNLVGTGGCKNVGLLAGTNKGKVTSVKVSGSVSAELSTNVGGAFGYTYENIGGIENSATINGLDAVGGVAGHVELSHNKSLSNGQGLMSKNTAKISGQSHIGGLFGEVKSEEYSFANSYAEVDVLNLENSGEVVGTKNCVGGIVGHVSSGKFGNKVSIANAKNTGTVTGDSFISGLVGYGDDSFYRVKVSENKGDITGTGNSVGGFVGGSAGGFIENGTNEGNITGGSYVGGLAGETNSLTDCKNKGTVKCTSHTLNGTQLLACLGGVVGYTKSINYCTNEGTIIASTQGDRIGGVAGSLIMPSGNAVVQDNKNTVDVTAQGNDVGGIFGYVNIDDTTSKKTIELKKNVNSGKVKSNSEHVGGIAGQIYSQKNQYSTYATGQVTFNTNTNNADVTGFRYVGGLVGYATYVNDDENIWKTNTQSGEVSATSEENPYSGTYYGIINKFL